jgi:hypothetical protein
VGAGLHHHRRRLRARHWPRSVCLAQSWLDHQKSSRSTPPLNLVSDNDIVGGNSGSPLLNRQGELAGFIFDGNIHSLGGSYGFDIARNAPVPPSTPAPSCTRSTPSTARTHQRRAHAEQQAVSARGS